MTRRIEFTVPDEVGELYDQARGDVPMAAWIKRALESALDGLGSDQPTRGESAAVPATAAPVPRGPASTRAPKTQRDLAMDRQRKLNERKS